MVFGIGQDGLWHFACDDSPFAYIMLVASAFSDFFFHTVRRSWAVLIYRGGLNGHTLVWGDEASTAGLHGAYT